MNFLRSFSYSWISRLCFCLMYRLHLAFTAHSALLTVACICTHLERINPKWRLFFSEVTNRQSCRIIEAGTRLSPPFLFIFGGLGSQDWLLLYSEYIVSTLFVIEKDKETGYLTAWRGIVTQIYNIEILSEELQNIYPSIIEYSQVVCSTRE